MKGKLTVLEVLKAIIEKAKKNEDYCARTSEIQEEIFGTDDPRDATRRKLQRYLLELEEEGWLEVCKGGYGRAGKSWRINREKLKDMNLLFVDDEKRRFLLALLGFIQKDFREDIVGKFKDIITSISLSKVDEKILKERIVRFEEFDVMSAEVNIKVLIKIIECMEKILSGEAVVLKFTYKKVRYVIPLRLGTYYGLIYLQAYDLLDLKKGLKIDELPAKLFNVHFIDPQSITILSSEEVEKLLNINNLKKIIKKLAEKVEVKTFPDEEPFVFGIHIRLRKPEIVDVKNLKFTPTQFFAEKIDDNRVRVFLIGYTGGRFAMRFLGVRDLEKIEKPSEEMLEKAREMNIKDIPDSLEENMRRFNDFKENVIKLLAHRFNLIANV